MKCRKCNNELNKDSKFCNMCGTQIELSTLEISDKLVNYSKRIFFFLGLLHGISVEQKEGEKLREIYKELKNNSEFSEDLNEVINFWEDAIKNKQWKK